jgi:hypothetical protein
MRSSTPSTRMPTRSWPYCVRCPSHPLLTAAPSRAWSSTVPPARRPSRASGSTRRVPARSGSAWWAQVSATRTSTWSTGTGNGPPAWCSATRGPRSWRGSGRVCASVRPTSRPGPSCPAPLRATGSAISWSSRGSRRADPVRPADGAKPGCAPHQPAAGTGGRPISCGSIAATARRVSETIGLADVGRALAAMRRRDGARRVVLY